MFVGGALFSVAVKNSTLSACAILVVAMVVLGVVICVSSFSRDGNILKRTTAAALAAVAFGCGNLAIPLHKAVLEDMREYDNKADCAEFKVVDFGTGFVDGKIITSEIGVPKRKIVRIYIDTEEDFIVGDYVRCNLEYNYKYKTSLASENISLTGSGEVIEHREGKGFLYAIRKSVNKNSNVLFGRFQYAESISKGIAINDRTDIDSYVFTLYKNAGISHVLAISGLHITLVAMSLHSLLLYYTRHYKLSLYICAAVAFVYTALVGFNVSALRALIMLYLYLGARLILRVSDSVTSMTYALFIIMLMNPHSICSVGMQLSFLCTLGILAATPYLERMQSYFDLKRERKQSKTKRLFLVVTPKVIAPLIITFASSVFSFPVLFSSFDTFSYISPIVNLVAVPIFSFGLSMSLLAYLFAPIATFLGMVFSIPAGISLDLVTRISKWVYEMDIGSLSVHTDFMIIPLLLSIALIAVLLVYDEDKMKFVYILSGTICLSLVFCAIYNNYTLNNKAKIIYYNEYDQCVFVSYDNGFYIDMGGYNSHPELVYETGCTSLESYVVWGYDSNTVRRFDYMSGTLFVKNVYMYPPKTQEEVLQFSKIKELANSRNCDIIIIDNESKYPEYFDIYGSSENLRNNSLICLNIAGNKIRILGEGYNYAVNCDVAIVTDEYNGTYSKILSENRYASEKYIDKNSAGDFFASFENCLRIEVDLKERDIEIYES